MARTKQTARKGKPRTEEDETEDAPNDTEFDIAQMQMPDLVTEDMDFGQLLQQEVVSKKEAPRSKGGKGISKQAPRFEQQQQKVMMPMKISQKKGGFNRKNMFDDDDEEETDSMVGFPIEMKNVLKFPEVELNQLKLNRMNQDFAFYNTTEAPNFEGLESATDFLISALAGALRLNPNLSNIPNFANEIQYHGLKNISIWSIERMYQCIDQSILKSTVDLRKRVTGCDQISDSLIVSLLFKKDWNIKDDLGIAEAAKVVIIKEENESICISDLVSNMNADMTDKAQNDSDSQEFIFRKIEKNNKNLNIFECSESMAQIFLSERNLIILTLNLDKSASFEDMSKSIIRRILQVLYKNILPSGILILGLGDKSNIERLKQLYEEILKDLEKLLDKTDKAFRDRAAEYRESDFQAERLMSSQIVCVEQLRIIKELLTFSLVEPKEKNDSLVNASGQGGKDLKDLDIKWKKALDGIKSVTKSDLNEYRSFKVPPSSMKIVFDAICVIFAKKPTYASFRTLSADPNFLKSLLDFDRSTVSDYVMNELKKYVEDPDFNMTKIKLISANLIVFADWILAVYEYAVESRKLTSSQSVSSYATLSDLMLKSSFYSFPWTHYFSEVSTNDLTDDSFSEEILKINKKLKAIEFNKSSPFLLIDQYTNLVSDKTMTLKYTSLPEKYAKSQSAKGNQFFNERIKTKLVITDLSWFAKVIQKLSSKTEPIQTFKELKSCIRSQLKRIQDYDKDEMVGHFIEYLSDLNLIYPSKPKNDSSPVKLLFMLQDAKPDKLEQLWLPKEQWAGFDLNVGWVLNAPLPDNLFSFALANLYDEDKTTFVAKNCLVNNDASCFVMITSIDGQIKLSGRLINSDKQLKLTSNFKARALEEIMLEYALIIQYMLVSNGIPFHYLSGDSSQNANMNSQVDTPAILKTQSVDDFYFNYFSLEHSFGKTKNNEQVTCTDCNQSLRRFIDLKNYKYFLFPNFRTVNLTEEGPGKTLEIQSNVCQFKLNSENSVSYKMSRANKDGLSIYNYDKFEMKFFNSNKGACNISFYVYFSNNATVPRVRVDMATNTYELIKNDSDKVELKFSKFKETNDAQSEPVKRFINPGDRLSIKLENMTDSSVDLAFHHNLERVVSVQINDLSIRPFPEVKIEPITSQPEQLNFLFSIGNQSPWYQVPESIKSKFDINKAKVCTLLNSAVRNKYKEAVNYFESNLKSLIENITTVFDGGQNLPRGLSIFPNSVQGSFLDDSNSLEIFNGSQLLAHMFCITFESLVNLDYENQKFYYLYTHLIDREALPISINKMDKTDLQYLALSAYLISVSENTWIMPYYEKIFPKYSGQPKLEINQKLRNYHKQLFQTLCPFIDAPSLLKTPKSINFNLDKLFKGVPDPAVRSYADLFYSKCTYCMACDSGDYEEKPVATRVESAYGLCLARFLLFNMEKETLNLNKKFSKTFPELQVFGIMKANLEFEKGKCYLNRIEKLREVILDNCKLEALPNHFFDSKSVMSLTISKNRIKSFSKEPRSISEIKKTFEDMPNLVSLELKDLLLNETDLFNTSTNKNVNLESKDDSDLILLPKTLKYIKLLRTPMRIFPFNLKDCKDLELLAFSGIKWIPLSTTDSVTEEALIKELAYVVDQEEAKKIFAYFDTEKQGELKTAAITKLNAYIFKRFPRLGMNEKLEIPPNPNNESFIPAQIFSLVNLTSLDLSYQAIRSIPDEIGNLKNLKRLFLNNCILLESLSSKVGDLPITELPLFNCLSLKTPPPEIVKRGTEATLSYLRRLSLGKTKCKQTKLMLVGLGEAGKTSLLNSLINRAEKPEMTDGIDINEWKVDLPDKSELSFSMWDFAGQSVYYNTHQFFLCSRAVYLLVWNVRLGSEYAGLDFWLSSIACHAPGAPIFVIGTHIDEVPKFTLNQKQLKERYKDIVGFYFVSNKTKLGIDELRKTIISTTLLQKYIGEEIPEVWLKFELLVKERSQKENLLTMSDMTDLGLKCGITDNSELLEVVRFLNDLGSLQYFETNGLKDNVVIRPQWIIDVISALVSVKNTPVKNGRLYKKDLKSIWQDFDESLHKWILQLTEEFDLTYSIPSGDFSLVPCLMDDEEPAFEWPELQNTAEDTFLKLKEFHVVYSFKYLPAGLFNRYQVRLYQYADNTVVWKNGSLLKKNNHLALVVQDKQGLMSISIKVHGVKPENIVWVLHEVLETLINEFYNGIDYEFSYSCPECVLMRQTDPFMFSSRLLGRAITHNAPFLQCQKTFHVVSIAEMSSIMPISSASTFDLNLENSIRDLKHLKCNMKYDIAFWYCSKDADEKLNDFTKSVNPKSIIPEISKSYKVWSSTNPAEERFDKITQALKESKMVILGISNNFSEDEKCLQVFDLVKNILRKMYLIVEFGPVGKRLWLENARFASVCADVRVIMQDQNRFKFKLEEVMDSLQRQIGDTKVTNEQENDQAPDVFISYCWSNSSDAVKKGTKKTETSLGGFDPRDLPAQLKKHGISSWIDVVEAPKTANLYSGITNGMNQASLVVACISDEYAKSQNCMLEFRFAHCSLKIPIVNAVIGKGSNWTREEISFLSNSYETVNFQTDDKDNMEKLIEIIKKKLKENPNKRKELEAKKNREAKEEIANLNNVAYQELYELTQRKFLRRLAFLSDSMQISQPYPRLFCIDLIDPSEYTSMVTFKARIWQRKPESSSSTKEDETPTPKKICLKALCEHEEGWHMASSFVQLSDVKQKYFAYLLRMTKIIKNSSLAGQMLLFSCEEGQQLLKSIEDASENPELDFDNSYTATRKKFIDQIEIANLITIEQTPSNRFAPDDGKPLQPTKDPAKKDFRIGLNYCELKNGRVLWLCDEHAKQTNARILTNSFEMKSQTRAEPPRTMLDDLENIKIDLV